MNLIWLGLFSAPLILWGRGKERSKTLSITDAAGLVREALPTETKRLPGLSLVPGEFKHLGRCVTFDVLWSNPDPGSLHVDFYTVDLQNAVIWSGPLPAELVFGPELARMQRDLRRKLGMPLSISTRAIRASPCWR